MNIQKDQRGSLGMKVTLGIFVVLVVLFVFSLFGKEKEEVLKETENTDNEENLSNTKGATTTENSNKTSTLTTPVQVKMETKTPVTAPIRETKQIGSTVSTSSETKSKNIYKDGRYNVIGNYISPAGNEALPVTLVLLNDTITESTVTANSENDTSEKFQETFSKEHRVYVVGKSIKDLNLKKISGSSLTPKGYNDALENIKRGSNVVQKKLFNMEKNQKTYEWVFEATGSRWSIDIIKYVKNFDEIKVLKEIRQRLELFESNYSRFRSDSLVTRMSRFAGNYELLEDAKVMLDLYKKLHDITGGAFTPLIGEIMQDSGYDMNYSFVPKKLKNAPIWNGNIKYNFPNIYLRKPVSFDFGAIGKGYAVDIVSDILKKNGSREFVVDAGGDIYYYKPGSKDEIEIGLENPWNVEEVIGIAKINNKSICGSSGNRRKWGNFHHIIDPRTLSPPKDIVATWVISNKTYIADALSTCLFLVSPKTLKDKFDFEYLIVHKDKSVQKSKGFKAKLFTKR